MSIALLPLRNAAVHELKGKARVGGNLSSTPVFSRLRFVANLGGALSIFSFDNATEQAADLRAFDYAKGEVAAAGGFGADTTASHRHTNVTKKGEAPHGGEAQVAGFELLALPPKKPGTVTDPNTITRDGDNVLVPTNAGATGGGAADDGQKFLLNEIADQYVPYVQIEGGRREYLPPLEWMKTDGGAWKAIVVFGEGWHWTKGSTLVFGMELKSKKKMPTALGAPQLAAALNDAFDITIADATNAYILQDVVVSTIGARIEPKGS